MKNRIPLIVLCMLFLTSNAWAMFGSLPGGVAPWASENGLSAGPVKTEGLGCLKGKRHVALSGSGVKGAAVFYHPIYKEATAVVSNVIFEFDPPISVGQARQWAIKLAKIIGTRPPTHKQKIKADASDPCIPASGGVEERYTKDWIVEFYPAGGKTQKISIYNDYIR